jgi:uncharacterized Tic20 family protein
MLPIVAARGNAAAFRVGTRGRCANLSRMDPSTSPAVLPTTPTTEERTVAMLAHLITFMSSFIGPLVIYLVKKDESAFVGEQAKEVLNFHLSVLIYAVVAVLSCFVLIGFALVPALGVFVLVTTIMGAISAYEGKPFRYPLCIRFL